MSGRQKKTRKKTNEKKKQVIQKVLYKNKTLNILKFILVIVII